MEPQSSTPARETLVTQPNPINPIELTTGQPLTETKQAKLKNDLHNLTRKEMAVITSLAKGHSYKMVADDCNITINTVRQHIRNIFRKLNIHSSVEAVLLAYKQKILFALFYINCIAS